LGDTNLTCFKVKEKKEGKGRGTAKGQKNKTAVKGRSG
jgi:hypothetical protein